MPQWAKPEEKNDFYVHTADAEVGDDKSAGADIRDARVIEDAVFGQVGADGKGPNFRGVSPPSLPNPSPSYLPSLPLAAALTPRSDSAAPSC